MSSRVNSPALTYRQEQAAATKRRIAEAAQRLFAADGYASTSLAAVAEAAGVASRTVYAAFGTKREILNLICESWLERADARALAASVLAADSAVERLRGAAHWLTVLYSTDFDVVRILDAAMDEDAETRTLLRSKLRGRNRVMDGLIASVTSELAVPLERAQTIFRAFAATGVYNELVIDSGWTPEQFENWLSDTLLHQLFPFAASITPARRAPR